MVSNHLQNKKLNDFYPTVFNSVSPSVHTVQYMHSMKFLRLLKTELIKIFATFKKFDLFCLSPETENRFI